MKKKLLFDKPYIPKYVRFDAISKLAAACMEESIEADRMCRAVHLIELAYVFSDKKSTLFQQVDEKLNELAALLRSAQKRKLIEFNKDRKIAGYPAVDKIDFEGMLEYALEKTVK